MIPWWDRYPDVYRREVEALRRRGITVISEGRNTGQLFLELDVPLPERGAMRVIAGYPDLFPYTRPEVAPKSSDVRLNRHQHPFGRIFCLIGPSTENWSVDDTLADLLYEQLPKVLRFESENADALRGLEDPVGESIANYYDYDKDACIYIDSGWQIEPKYANGKLRLAFSELRPLRGAVTNLYDAAGNELIVAEAAPGSRFDKSVFGQWVRWPKAINLNDPTAVLGVVRQKFPGAVSGDRRKSRLDRPSVLGIVFRDEIQQGIYGDNWIFISQGKTPRFVRALRAGRGDLSNRIPELKPIQSKRVAVIGTGCLGAPSALEFARAGVSALKLADRDLVETGTTVRWPLGLQAAGQEKVSALRVFIENNYPYTAVEIFPGMIGSAFRTPQYSDAEHLDRLLDVDLIFDATAEAGIQHVLSDLAAEHRIPYVCVSTTPGGWGGFVYRQRADARLGCWSCLRRFMHDGHIPIPIDKPDDMLQPAGCATATFTGTSFDAGFISLMAVRIAVSTLCAGYVGGYPDVNWDCAVVNLRSPEGDVLAPCWQTFSVPPHQHCGNVSAHRPSSATSPATA
jgi:hypothetical protein